MPPVCTILGGANGSGKSSLYGKLQVPGAFVNADRYARRLDPEHPDRASRQAGRVRKGGHAIAEPVIRRRYEKSLLGLMEAIRLADGTLVYDNSSTSPELIVRLRGSHVEENRLDGRWRAHLRMADVIASALKLSADVVLPTP